jgi:hypothetical protein
MPGLRANNAINLDFCMLLPALHCVLRVWPEISINSQRFAILTLHPTTIQVLLQRLY